MRTEPAALENEPEVSMAGKQKLNNLKNDPFKSKNIYEIVQRFLDALFPALQPLVLSLRPAGQQPDCAMRTVRTVKNGADLLPRL